MPVLRAPSVAAARRFPENRRAPTRAAPGSLSVATMLDDRHVAELGALTRMHVGFDRVSGSGSQSGSSISGIL